MRRTADVIRAIAAALASGLLVLGLPALLISSVGWPLPRQLPTIGGIADTMTGSQPLDSATVWEILAVILWVAWLQVLVAFVIEVVSVVRGSLPRSLPGLHLAHGLVGPLVAAIVLIWPLGAAPRAAATPLASNTPPPRAPAPSGALAAERPSAETTPTPPAVTEHTVVRRDTLWDLAERYLGDGYRAPEIFELNRGRPQPDGGSLTDPSLIRPGWILQIPTPSTAAPRVEAVTVQPGDTLWDIAAEHLDDGHRYTEIAKLNRDHRQPDGRTLSDANVIEPGWVLDLPAIERGEEPIEAPTGAVAPPTPPPTTQTEPDTTTTSVPHAPTPTASESVSSGAAASADVDDGDDESHHSLPVGLFGGGVATVGVLAVLERRRRAQHRRRERGQIPPPMTAAQEATDIALRAGADTEVAMAIDGTLRAAAARSGATGLAPIKRVEAADGRVSLALEGTASAPAGFHASDAGMWEIDDPQAPTDVDCAAPAPTLVAVGRTNDGAEVLIDLEHPPVTTLHGDTGVCGEIANSIALAVASAPWSDHARVLVVGQPVPPLDDLESISTVTDALDQLEAHADVVARALDSAHCVTLGQARAAGVTPDLWAPLVSIITTTPTTQELDRIRALAARDRGGVAAVVVAQGGVSIGRSVAISITGEASIDGGDPFTARAIPDEQINALTDLLTHAEQDCVPVKTSPPVASSEDNGDGAAVRTALTNDLDVIVRVLGDIECVRAPDGDRLNVPKQKSLEAVTYLALRESRVDREDLQAALWPAGANSPKTFHNTIWAARKMLGHDRDSSDLMPEPVDGHYQLSERVGTDYGLFHELTARAEETDDAPRAADLLSAALTLVRGEPFTGVGRSYAWVAPHAGLIVAQVVDAAEELAEMRLAEGDWRGAEWAARQGLRVFPCEERLYRLLMRAAHAAGSLPGVHRAFQELAAAVADPDDGVEPDDTIHPDTIALLDELTRRVDRASA